MGFTHGPGGSEYDDRQVLSYHVYCGDVDHKGDPRSTFICEAGDRFILDARVDQVRYEIGAFPHCFLHVECVFSCLSSLTLMMVVQAVACFFLSLELFPIIRTGLKKLIG
jgi:hypothetical protein